MPLNRPTARQSSTQARMCRNSLPLHGRRRGLVQQCASPASAAGRARSGAHTPESRPALLAASSGTRAILAAFLAVALAMTLCGWAPGADEQPSGPVDAKSTVDAKTASDAKTTPAKRAAPSRAGSLPLAKHPNAGEKSETGAKPSTSGGSSVLGVMAALGVVLGLFFAVAWLMRRSTPGNYGLLPSEVVEVLGRLPLAARQQVHLIRVGNKLVLICATPAGVESLTEVTEPEEVARLAGLCRRSQPNNSTAVFRQFFQQFTREHESMQSPRGEVSRRAKETSRGAQRDGP
jgi:flagellar biogenesis protein FliO